MTFWHEYHKQRNAPWGHLNHKRDGAFACEQGQPMDANPNPPDSAPWRFWNDGWIDEARKVEIARAADVEARQREADEKSDRIAHDCLHWAVSQKLAELGIDPYELRDYLAGLP